MKTAFITLVAASMLTLAHGAPALTLNSSQLETAGGSYTLTEGIGSGYGNFSVTMALDAQAFQNAIKAGNVAGNIFSANNNKIGLGLNYISSAGTAGLYGSWDGGTYSRAITTVDNTPNDGDTPINLTTGLKALFTNNTYSSAAITYQITDTGTWTYLTLVDSTGNDITYEGRESGLKTGSFGALTSFTYGTDYITHLVVDNTALGSTDTITANLNAIAAAAVPEPATASLSLIGLAALLMRRKRA